MSVFVKALACASLLAASPAVPQTSPQTKLIAQVQIVCPTAISPDGHMSGWAGTGVRVGPHLMISAAHVTNHPFCIAEGKQIHPYNSRQGDWSLIQTEDAGPYLKIDCGGFVKGRKYIAAGFARGKPELFTVELTATGKTENGFSLLWGIVTLIPGQSGGSLVDKETGRLVGINNVADWESGLSGSVALKDTPLCH